MKHLLFFLLSPLLVTLTAKEPMSDKQSFFMPIESKKSIVIDYEKYNVGTLHDTHIRNDGGKMIVLVFLNETGVEWTKLSYGSSLYEASGANFLSKMHFVMEDIDTGEQKTVMAQDIFVGFQSFSPWEGTDGSIGFQIMGNVNGSVVSYITYDEGCIFPSPNGKKPYIFEESYISINVNGMDQYGNCAEMIVGKMHNQLDFIGSDEKIAVEYGKPIGTLPKIEQIKGYKSVWSVLGEPIMPDTLWKWAGDRTAEIKRIPNPHSINLYEEDGTTLFKRVTCAYKEKIELPDVPYKKGYIGKWVAENGDEYDVMPDEDLNFKARYEVATLTVRFFNDGRAEDVDVQYGQPITQPANPRKKGHSFKGWYIGNEPFDFSTPITHNITLTAKWENNYRNFTLTFIISPLLLLSPAIVYLLINLVRKKGGKTQLKTSSKQYRL